MTSELDQLQNQELARSELQKAQLFVTANPEQALEHLLRAEKLDPKNTSVLKLLGRNQLRLSQTKDAVNTLERLLKMEPKNSEALSTLAFGLRQLNHFELAKECASDALRQDAQDFTAREVLADCLVAEKDFSGCLRELNLLIQVYQDEALARVSLKAAFCHLQLGFHTRALEITSILLKNGYDDENVMAIRYHAENLVQREIEEKLKHMTWIQRVFNRLANKALLHLHLEGSKGMGKLREGPGEASDYEQPGRNLTEDYKPQKETASSRANPKTED